MPVSELPVVPRIVECLSFLGERVAKEASDDPRLSSGERASLLMAAALIGQVRDQQLTRVASQN
jgi:hypothetical protein